MISLPAIACMILFSSTSPRKFGHLLAVTHHNDAMAGAQYFLQLGGNKHAGLAFFSQRKYQFLNFSLCSHINASGGFIQDQKLWVRGKPTCQDHLLLVATAQILDEADRPREWQYSTILYISRQSRIVLAELRYLNQPRLACMARMMFSLTVNSPTIPAAFRSSGQSATPRPMESIGEKSLTDLPSILSEPLSGLSRPNKSCAISVRPEPSKPARPTTSPACNSRSKGSIDPERPRPFASSSVSLFMCLLAFKLMFCHIFKLGQSSADHFCDQFQAR